MELSLIQNKIYEIRGQRVMVRTCRKLRPVTFAELQVKNSKPIAKIGFVK